MVTPQGAALRALGDLAPDLVDGGHFGDAWQKHADATGAVIPLLW
ncbi:MAG TPA: hypothetical protein VLT47_06830 [Anaeromyxobacteraceae bacterium]|nr:hypothetical protein [Anaeromyxobacteraceae bacterium]